MVEGVGFRVYGSGGPWGPRNPKNMWEVCANYGSLSGFYRDRLSTLINSHHYRNIYSPRVL